VGGGGKKKNGQGGGGGGGGPFHNKQQQLVLHIPLYSTSSLRQADRDRPLTDVLQTALHSIRTAAYFPHISQKKSTVFASCSAVFPPSTLF